MSNSQGTNTKDVWPLAKIVEEAMKFPAQTKVTPHSVLSEQLFRLSVHSYFQLSKQITVEPITDIAQSIVKLYALYVKQHERQSDDAFAVNAMGRCVMGGFLIGYKNLPALKTECTCMYDVAELLVTLQTYADVQSWNSDLLKRMLHDFEEETVAQINSQMLFAVQFLYTWSGKAYQVQGGLRQLPESYSAAVEYGIALGSLFKQ